MISPEAPEHLDVLVVGAGLSGIGLAWHLQQQHPWRSVALLEAREELGGTWSLFRYPGIRSDSDLATFAYRFRPWTGDKAIADGPDILRYLRDTAAESGIDAKVRYGHRVVRASWSTPDARWTVEVEVGGQTRELTCSWFFCAGGYYRYDEGFTPDFPGVEQYDGTLVHPQQWPEDLDTAGKRVVVIGSGATAVTLVPALAVDAGHVTMLQRSPSYVLPVPSTDPIANLVRKIAGPERAHRFTRRKNIAQQRFTYRLARTRPELSRKIIRGLQGHFLPKDYDFSHFTPTYQPWDQRMCMVPDADLFKAIRRGTASVVTDRIETFTPTGIRLASGAELEADIVVTATGLQLLAFGGIELVVDGTPVSLPDTVSYKGMMLSGVPNFGYAIGYTNASWTLKVDLVAEHLCRLLSAMDAAGATTVTPELTDPSAPTRPLLDFAAGYVTRAIDGFPRQGQSAPWSLNMDYNDDVEMLARGTVLDPVLRLGGVQEPAAV